MKTLKTLMMVAVVLAVALGWLAIIDQAFSQSSNDDRFFNTYKIKALCRADRPEEVERMVEAVQAVNDELHSKLFADPETKCYITRMFGRESVTLEFVREMRQVLDINGLCWSIIELRDGLGTAYVSWTGCPELPGENA